MSDPNNNVVPLRADPDDSSNPSDLSNQLNQAAQPETLPAHIAYVPPAPRIHVSFSIQSFGNNIPATQQQPTTKTVPANDPHITELKRIIGGILYLGRYDALEKLLSGDLMNALRQMKIEGSKQSALANLLNANLYVHPGSTTATTTATPNTHNAYLINKLCSQLTDAPNESADRMQTHIRNVIRTLLTMEDIECNHEERYRKEKKPFHYIATSGNLEFVELFIAHHVDLVPMPHSDEGKDILATLKSEYMGRKPMSQKAEAAERVNAIIAMISEATTQRDLNNGNFSRISPEQYIASLMGETPTAIDIKNLPAAEAPKAIPAPAKPRKSRKDRGLEPQ